MNQIKKILKNEKGFTLVELVIVVLILGILVAIAVPRFVSATDNAKEQARKATARTIMSAIVMAQAANPDTPADKIDETMVNEYLENITVKKTATPDPESWGYDYDESNKKWKFYYTPKGSTNSKDITLK